VCTAVRLNHAEAPETTDTAARRQELEERLTRTRDLYELGDLSRPKYIARRDAIHAELATLTPQPSLDLDHARQVLEDFATFWQREHDPNAKRQFLHLIFDGVWIDDHRVVAVQPKPSFLPFFQQQRQRGAGAARAKYGSDGTQARVCRLGDRDSAVGALLDGAAGQGVSVSAWT
jgi:hypothetical protein